MSAEMADFIRTLHPELKRKVKASMQAVLEEPRAGKALKDKLEGLRSFRVGKLRIVYSITRNKGIIEIVAVGPRKTIYEETLRLLKRK
jgi:mRNA interferase RelE/StbE